MLQREDWGILSEKFQFWKEQKGYLYVIPFYVAVLGMLAFLYQVNLEICFYITAFYVIFSGIALALQYSNFKKRKLKELQEETKEDSIQETYQQQQESEDFFALWTHQIKTPIAAMNVLLQEPQVNAIACRQELIKIEGYVEMALGYTRYENMSNDLLLESYELEPIVKNVVKKYATIFIYKHITIQLDQLGYKVLTDEKWLTFVLEQILSNALKYTMQGGIRIYGKEEEAGFILVVEDTGMGIKEEDLPRIFEKGFTGYNGRMDKKASGLGLYLCHGICNKLGHQIWVESRVNQGTKVSLLLPCEKIKKTDLTFL